MPFTMVTKDFFPGLSLSVGLAIPFYGKEIFMGQTNSDSLEDQERVQQSKRDEIADYNKTRQERLSGVVANEEDTDD